MKTAIALMGTILALNYDYKILQRSDLYEENVKCNYWYGKCPVFT